MTSSNKHGADQFEILSFVQNGNGSKIYDVIQKQRNRKYTMEVVPRKNSTQTDEGGGGDASEAKNTRLHKHSQLKAPSCYLTQLKYSFQTKTRKYFVLSHLHSERNLSALLQKQKVISEQVSAYIIIQIIAGIDQLHQANVPYDSLDVGHVYFDNKGHVILKRTYNHQTCWTSNECYGCHRNKCKNQYHNNGSVLSDAAKANDFNNVGQLLVYLVTGSQHSYSLLESLHQQTKEFAYLLLRHDVDMRKIRTHPYLANYPWNNVLNKELDAPDEIVRFLRDTRDRQSSQSKTLTQSPVERLINVGGETMTLTPPCEILVGVRKTRSKSEEASRFNNRQLTQRGKQIKERSKSYNSSDPNNKYEILNRSKSFSKSRSESRNSVFGDDTINENDGIPAKSRRTSIDMYQKRLQEISKVLDKNRDVTDHSSPPPTINQYSNEPSRQSSPTTQNTDSDLESRQEPTANTSEFFFEKMYSENEALRTILTKYGLLKERKQNNDENQENEEEDREESRSPVKIKNKIRNRSMSTLQVPFSPESNNLIMSSKRKQRRSSTITNSVSNNKKMMSRSCNNIQILFENTDINDKDANGHVVDAMETTSSMGKVSLKLFINVSNICFTVIFNVFDAIIFHKNYTGNIYICIVLVPYFKIFDSQDSSCLTEMFHFLGRKRGRL